MTSSPNPTIEAKPPARPEGYKGLAGFHKYWGKKPTEAWRLLISTLTDEGDLVVDPFLGSGLIAREAADLGRRFVGVDVNPMSIEMSRLFLDPPVVDDYQAALDHLVRVVKPEISSLYRTEDGSTGSHYLWDGDELEKVWRRRGTTRTREELEITEFDRDLARCHEGYELRTGRRLNVFDNARINTRRDFSLGSLFTGRALKSIDLLSEGILSFPPGVRRSMNLTLTASMGQMSKMVFAITKKGKTKGKSSDQISIGSWVIGYWRPGLHFEINAWNCFENKAQRLAKALGALPDPSELRISADPMDVIRQSADTSVTVGDSAEVLRRLSDGVARVVLTDPPHGDRMPYLEMSEMWNAVLGLESNYAQELVVSNAAGREQVSAAYSAKLTEIMSECSRVLRQDGVLALMFNTRSEEHWATIGQFEKSAGLLYIGCYPMEYSAGSVVQDNRKGALKDDLVLLFGKERSTAEAVRRSLGGVPNWSDELPQNGVR